MVGGNSIAFYIKFPFDMCRLEQVDIRCRLHSHCDGQLEYGRERHPEGESRCCHRPHYHFRYMTETSRIVKACSLRYTPILATESFSSDSLHIEVYF